MRGTSESRAVDGFDVLRLPFDPWLERELRKEGREVDVSRADRPLSSSVSTPMADRPSHFRAGETVADRYRVVRWIASGGMGDVYEVEDALARTVVALKTLAAGPAAAPEIVERLRRELVLARRIPHPSVCRVYDIGLHRGGPSDPPLAFLTMELLQGETLGSCILREGPLDPRRAREILVPVLEGLAALHEEGILHRDLKTDNVFLAKGGDGAERVVITDFGVALDLTAADEEGLTRSGVVVGTLEYASPELLEGEPLTPRSDLYSVGVVVHEMLTGKRPFSGASSFSEAAQRLFGDPAPIARLGSPEADRLAELSERCLERDPARRFATAAEALESLRAANAPSRSRRPRARPRGGARAVVLGAGALAAVLIALALAWPSIRPGTRRSPAAARPEAFELYVRGKALRNLEGIELLRRSAELDPSFVPAWTALAAAYLQSTGPHLLGWKGYEGAEQALERALALEPGNRDAGLLLPIVQVETGRAAEGVARLEQLRRAAPRDADVLWTLSYGYRYLGLLERSLELGQRALEREPRLREDASWAFNTLLYLGRVQEFVDTLPSRVDSYTTFYRGYAALHLGQDADAARLFSEAYRLDATSFYAQAGKAVELGLGGDAARGEVILDALWEGSKKGRANDGETLLKLAEANWKLGRGAEALAAAEASIDQGFLCVSFLESDPLLKGLWALPGGAGLLERARGKQREALAALERAP
ncbi:MAG: protein kinase [Holophagales bacterium]|nr:protein kinase [Holophagales bacterium]MBK9967591.1 protein kinase [Holophagales bacterium]